MYLLQNLTSSPSLMNLQACDIKDPMQNIEWTVPEGGGGPGYTIM